MSTRQNDKRKSLTCRVIGCWEPVKSTYRRYQQNGHAGCRRRYAAVACEIGFRLISSSTATTRKSVRQLVDYLAAFSEQGESR